MHFHSVDFCRKSLWNENRKIYQRTCVARIFDAAILWPAAVHSASQTEKGRFVCVRSMFHFIRMNESGISVCNAAQMPTIHFFFYFATRRSAPTTRRCVQMDYRYTWHRSIGGRMDIHIRFVKFMFFAWFCFVCLDGQWTWNAMAAAAAARTVQNPKQSPITKGLLHLLNK